MDIACPKSGCAEIDKLKLKSTLTPVFDEDFYRAFAESWDLARLTKSII